MLTKDAIVALLCEHRSRLACEFGVRRIGLFGSFARGQATEASDIDLVVEFDTPIGLRFVDLVEDLERVFGRKVGWDDGWSPCGHPPYRACAPLRGPSVGSEQTDHRL